MSDIYLQDWLRRQRVFRLGEHGMKDIDPRGIQWSGILSGYGFMFKRDSFGIYVIDSALYFVAGGERWRASEALTAAYNRILMVEKFSLQVDGRSVFSRIYWRPDGLRELMADPALDEFDEDRIFFLRWCSRVLNNPRQQAALAERWKDWRWADQGDGQREGL